jgi:hypothetical protein
MNTTAYDIRLSILSIAHGDLMSVFHEKLYNTKKKMIGDQNHDFIEDKIDDDIIDKLLPTSEDIIKRAKELYAFVEKP